MTDLQLELEKQKQSPSFTLEQPAGTPCELSRVTAIDSYNHNGWHQESGKRNTTFAPSLPIARTFCLTTHGQSNEAGLKRRFMQDDASVMFTDWLSQRRGCNTAQMLGSYW